MSGTNRGATAGTTRRRFLQRGATAVGIGAVGTNGLAGVRAQSQPKPIRLGGKISGWQGQTPEGIAGTTNPTLDLNPGTTYRVVWENLDGRGHNVALLDGDGEVLQRTEVMSEEGATQTIEFTASEAMAEYVCEPHISSMNGTIAVGAETTTATAANESSEDDGPEALIPQGATVRTETITEGTTTAPLGFEVPPSESGRYFIVDRVGQVYVHESGSLREEPFIDVSDRLAEITGEMGLLGMAVHPNYGENRKFYLRYSAPSREGTPEDFDHTEVLSEFKASEDGSEGLVDSERTLLEIPSPYDTHNSGAVTFGSDGYLYMGMGDGGGGHDRGIGHVADWYDRFGGMTGPDVSGNGQDVTENLLGSVLRIDVDSREGDTPYGIPDDNPLVGQPGLPEQFAWGFRNPWRMGFSNGRLFVTDVGQSLYEEVSIVEKGRNYGWNVREGSHCFKPGPEGSTNPPEDCPTELPDDVRDGEQLVPPVIEYPHRYDDQNVGVAAIGGYIYEDERAPALDGKYVFGDYRAADADTPTGSLFAATPREQGQWPLEELQVADTESGRIGGFVLAFGRDNERRLYVLTSAEPGEGDTGAVHRLHPPEQRSQSGTATASTTTTPTETESATTGNTVQNSTPAGNATAEATASATAGAGGETVTDTSSSSGPGFGVLAVLAGVGGIVVRGLLNR